MKQIAILLLLIMFNGCQFFLPTSNLDQEPLRIFVNDTLYLSDNFFCYTLTKKDKTETETETADLIVCDSIDSIYVGTKVFIIRKSEYFILNKDSIKLLETRPKVEFKSMDYYFSKK